MELNDNNNKKTLLTEEDIKKMRVNDNIFSVNNNNPVLNVANLNTTNKVRITAEDINKTLSKLGPEDELTNEEILNEPTLIQGMREILKARFAPEARMGNFTDYRYDNENMTDEQVLDQWQEWMRGQAVVNTLDTLNNVAWFSTANDDQKAMLGASFNIYDKTAGIFSSETTGAEKWDAGVDYIWKTAVDPQMAAGGMIGYLFGKVGKKTAMFNLRKVALAAYTKALQKGASKEVAEAAKQRVFRSALKNAGTRNTFFNLPNLGLLGTEVLTAIAFDRQEQFLRIGSGVQDKINVPQNALAGFGAIMIPTFLATREGAKYLLKKGLKVEEYIDINKKFGGKSPDQIFRTVVDETNLDATSKAIGEIFENFDTNSENYTKWTIARDDAKKLVNLKDIAGKPDELNDFFETLLLFGSPDEKQKGLITALGENGFIFIPRGKDDTISNFIGDIIGELDDTYIAAFQGSFKKKFGENALKDAGLDKIINSKELSAWFKNRSSAGGKILFNRMFSSKLLNKQMGDLTFQDMLDLQKKLIDPKINNIRTTADYVSYAQSVWKRFLTANSGTTALNVRGWGYMQYLNSLSDVAAIPLQLISAGEGKTRRFKGSISAISRKGYNYLNAEDTMETALNFLMVKPEVAEELLRAGISGGVDSAEDLLKRLNINPNNPVVRLTESSVDILQFINGVRLQDEMTKLLSFQNELDKQIKLVYGMNYNKFMNQPNAYNIMFSQKFLEEVQRPAIIKAQKETFSFSFSKETAKMLKNPNWRDKLPNFPLAIAKGIERFSDAAGGGLLVPFGRFFNISTQMTSDYMAINAMRNLIFRSYPTRIGKGLSQEQIELYSKGAVGMTVMFGAGVWAVGPPAAAEKAIELAKIGYDKLTGGTDIPDPNQVDQNLDPEFFKTLGDSALNQNPMTAFEAALIRINKGLNWNQEELSSGGIEDKSYDVPEAYVRIGAQIIAHRYRDDRVPKDLKKAAADLWVFNLTRDTQRSFSTIYDLIETAIDPDFNHQTFKMSVDILLGTGARIGSGFSRPFESLNTLMAVRNDDFTVKDPKIADTSIGVFKNQVLKYVDQLLPFVVGKPMGDKTENRINLRENQKDKIVSTRQEIFPTVTRVLGSRQSYEPTPIERMAAVLGQRNFIQNSELVDSKLPNEYKQYYTQQINDRINYYALRELEGIPLDDYYEKNKNGRYKNYLELPLFMQQQRYKHIINQVKKDVKESLKSLIPSNYLSQDETDLTEKEKRNLRLYRDSLIAKLEGTPKRTLRDRLKYLNIEVPVREIGEGKSLSEEIEKLEYIIKYLKPEYDADIYGRKGN